MVNAGDEFPAGEDYIVRRIKDLERRVSENASARSLAASQIGSGGLLINSGGSLTIAGGGSLNVGSGALNSAGSISAGTTISAGGAITGASLGVGGGAIAGGAITGASVAVTGAASSATVSATGDVTAANVQLGNNGTVYSLYALNNAVTSAYFALYVNGDGRFGRSVSARRYKQDIASWSENMQAVFALRLVTYRLRTAVAEYGNAAPIEVGLIAEELEAVGLGWLVLYIDGQVEGIAYEKLALALLPVVQDHEARLLKVEAWIQAHTA
jgi:hypothetical protein